MKGTLRKLQMRTMAAAGAMLLLAAVGYAQSATPDAAPAPGPGPHGHGPGFGPGFFGDRMEFLGITGMRPGKVVTGAPFSASATAETKRTLADGTTITHNMQSNLFRDSEGRVRKEVTVPTGTTTSGGTAKTFVMIHDPVAKTGYILDPSKKVAHAMPVHGNFKRGANSETIPPAHGGRGGNQANVTKESLGTQTINGVSAQGTRITRVIPAGSRMGNDKPITTVREEWYSPDLQMMVQIKESNPLRGDTTYTVSNIQRTAPSANLFTVPSDYTVTAASVGPHHGMHQGGAPAAAPSE